MLQDKKKLEPSGEPSLQNGLEMARGSMRFVSLFFESPPSRVGRSIASNAVLLDFSSPSPRICAAEL